MRAKPDGFELVFTKPVDRATAADLASYEMTSYTYQYHQVYGSDELFTKPVELRGATVSADGRRVHLKTGERRAMFVHELLAKGVRSTDGEALVHPDAYYTLNRIPK